MNSTIFLQKSFFTEKEKTIYHSESGLTAKIFTYDSGVYAIKISNNQGYLTILPYMGQIIWDAQFNDVNLRMKNPFKQPIPAKSIIETYGCFMLHSGILRNGCPSPQDNHILHGEFACANMDSSYIKIGTDEQGEYIQLFSEYCYTMGFGDNYQAKPSVKLYSHNTLFEINMEITNLSSVNMELMYMAHMNYAYVENAKFIDPVTEENKTIRTSIPDHVKPNKEWLDYIEKAKNNISILNTLDTPEMYQTEIVLFLKNLKVDKNNHTHMLMKHPDGNSFYNSYNPEILKNTVRWILNIEDQKVSAFSLPATCQPEGYIAEKEKGNIYNLPAKQTVNFTIKTGLLNQQQTTEIENIINSL